MIGAGVFDELTSVAISNFVRSKEVHERMHKHLLVPTRCLPHKPLDLVG